jgi:ATP/maltotriose-dependent transcriptional regulator MalT
MLRSVGTSRLVGRDEDLAILESALEQARGGRPSITLVVGEYGIGKTRLMSELEVRARRQGIRVLGGECVPLEGTELPYGPIGSGLRNLPRDVLAGALEPLPDSARALLASAFPQLPAPAGASSQTSAGDLQQSRFYEFLLALLQALSEASPLLVIIEDFHWADSATRNFVSFLVRNLRRQRIALVVTDRMEDVTASDRRWMEDLSKRAERVELTGLDRAAVRELLAAGLGEPPPGELVDEVFKRSAGNPFFAEELLAARMNRRSGALPATLKEALITRVERLSPDAQRVVLAAAAVARACGSALLGGAASLREPELSRAVREALLCNVLEQPSAGDAFQFRHDVVREVVYENLMPGERAELHARVAATMVELGAAVGPGELAYHWRAAGRTVEAVAASIEAARATYEAHAYSEALGHFDRALALADEAGALPEAVDRSDLLRIAAETARYAGDNTRATALVEEALRYVDAAAEPMRAALLHELWGHCQGFAYEAALRGFRTALDLLPASHDADRARLLGAEANALLGVGTWSAVREGAEQATAALGLAVRVGARAEEAHARIMLGLAMALLGEPAEGAEHLRRARTIADELGRAEYLLRAELYLGEALRLAGDFAAALVVMDDGRARAAELGMDASFGRYMALNSAEDLFLLGRWGDAGQRLDEAEIERDPTSWNTMLWGVVAGKLALGLGEPALAEAQLERSLAVHEAAGRPPEYAAPLHAALAELALARREHDAARRLIDSGREAVAGQADLLYAPTLFSIGARVEAEAADAGRTPRVQAAQRAAELCDALEAMMHTTPPPSAVAHLALSRAELSRTTGEADPARWEAAAARWDEVHAPYEAAYARAHHAEALLQGRGDRDVAIDLLARAYATAEQLGATQLRRTVELLAGRDLVHLRVRAGPPEPEAAGPDFDLTAREREVLALLAAGLTNRAIAEQLVISEKTAGAHVAHIFAKLDVHDRRVAATRAYQLGLAGPPSGGGPASGD